MPEETRRSEQDETFLGEPYTQHYDEEGQKAGWSEGKETFWGNKYTQHYNEGGSKAGTNEIKETLWGDKYIQRYDEEGNKVGYSEEKTDFWGRSYTQHYDESGNEIGQTEAKETFFGKKYQEHKMKRHFFSSGASWIKNLVSLGSWPVQIVVTSFILVAILFVISAVVMGLLLALPIVLVSSIAAFIFAEALKRKADWALSIQQNYGSRSIWFGPVVALGSALLFLAIMTATGMHLYTEDVVAFLVLGAIAFWLSKQASLKVMRWRMADAVKGRE